MKRRHDPRAQVPAVPSVFRPRDLNTLKLSRTQLRSMVRAGEVEQIGRGLYRYHAVEATELETIATICARVPHGIVCLLHHGVATRMIQGVPMRITSPARTVVDCFRYRNKLGLDIALEALRDALGRKLATVDELVRAAEACRIYSVMKPYLQAVLS
jgi:predicted transcriptional regulator of viral defense system